MPSFFKTCSTGHSINCCGIIDKGEESHESGWSDIAQNFAKLTFIDIKPSSRRKHPVVQHNRKVIYAVVLRALYSILVVSLLWYEKFRKDLESIGFN